MSQDTPTQWVSGADVAVWLGITERHARRLLADGVLPKRKRRLWDLQGCVAGYIRHLQGMVKRGGNGEYPTHETEEDDPAAMPVEVRLKYWQAVRQRQASREHLEELAAQFGEEYGRQTAEAARAVREAIEAAGLAPEQLAAIRAAIATAFHA